VLIVIGAELCGSILLHGKDKEGTYNFLEIFVFFTGLLALLTWGGFFN
jgi:hypothetical protein